MSLQDRLRKARAENFVGRDQEISFFTHNLVAEIPDYPFLQVAGQGGVGKSTLLRRFQTLCQARNLPHALTDERDKTPPQAMRRLADQLSQAGHPLPDFTERHQTFLQLQEKIEKEPDRPDLFAQLFSRAAGKSAVVVGRVTPVTSIALDLVGPELVESQVSALSGWLFQKLKNKDEVQLLLDPTAELSPRFVADLNHIAQAQQLILFFDTFEETEAGLLPWLLRLFDGDYGNVSDYISFIFAGRSFDPHTWLPVQPLLRGVTLEPFTLEETVTYLTGQGLSDPEQIAQIHHLSGGLPVYVAMLVAPGGGAPGQATRSVVERFLRHIDDPLRRQLALHLALARHFDRDVLAALLPPETGPQAIAGHFAWLTGMPFVQAQEDGWRYHPLVKEQMTAYQRYQSRDQCALVHQSLAGYYTRQANRRGYQAPDRWQHHPAWWSDYLEATYHHLCAEPRTYLPTARVALAEILFHLRLVDQATLSWVTTLFEATAPLVEDEPARAWAEEVRQVFISMISGQLEGYRERLFTFFDQLCQAVVGAGIPPVLARMHILRGTSQAELGRLEAALADFDRAIQLDPQDAPTYYNRGLTYYQLENYPQALADFDRAIELDPQLAPAYANRGLTYDELGDYPQALADFDRAIDLDPQFAQAYVNRGNTYYKQGNYPQALADFDRAIELDPQLASAYNNRGNTYAKQENYPQALADFDHAIELDPEFAPAYHYRGLTYYQLENYPQALADYTHAIELDPQYTSAYNSRGNAYAKQENYPQALADYSHAIELDPQYAKAYYNTACAYARQGHLDLMLPPLRRALELNPAKTLADIPTDPDFDRVRDDPRLQALLAEFTHAP